jgi:hypothetical protein
MANKFERFITCVARDLNSKLAARDFAAWTPKYAVTEMRCFYFRRKLAEEIHLLELYADTNERLRCCLSVGRVNGSPFLTYWGQEIVADEVTIGALQQSCALRGNSIFVRGYFVPPIHHRLRGPVHAGNWVVAAIERQLESVDAWFCSGKVSAQLICMSKPTVARTTR